MLNQVPGPGNQARLIMVTQSFDFKDRETNRRNIQCKRTDGCRSRSIRGSNRLSISTNHDAATTAPRAFAWTKSRDVLNLATAMTAQQLGHVNDPKNNRSFNRFMYTSPFKAMTTVGPAKRSKTPVPRHPILLSADHEGKRWRWARCISVLLHAVQREHNQEYLCPETHCQPQQDRATRRVDFGSLQVF